MKLFYCQHKEDYRDTWYEMDLGNGNKMGIVYRGYGQMEFWGGRLSDKAERTLLFDTELKSNFETLSDRLHELFCSATGEKAYPQVSHIDPLWFSIAQLMSIVEGMKERSPGLFPEHEFKGHHEKFNKQILDAHKAVQGIKILVTASGENTTHSIEDRVTELEGKVEQIMPTTN